MCDFTVVAGWHLKLLTCALCVGCDHRGAAFTLGVVQGMLLAGINAAITLYSWQASGDSHVLKKECQHEGNIMALYTSVRGNFVLVGDLMKSMSLLAYNKLENKLEQVAHDAAAKW